MGIPNIGVSMVIFNSVDISCRWCDLYFWPIWGQVKMPNFSERIAMRRQHFHLLHKFLRITSQRQLGKSLLRLIWIYHYLLNRTELELDFHKSCSIQKYLTNFAANNINVWFFTQHILSDQKKLDLIIFCH